MVEQILNGLKQRLSDKSTLITQGPEGSVRECTFTFHSGATNKEIAEFENYASWKLPEDLLAFLRIHNGGHFYEDEYGTRFQFLKLSEMMQYHTDYMPDHYYTIAIFMGSLLIVDSDTVRRGEDNCLYWYEVSEFHPIKGTFAEWLDRFVMAQCQPYWMWGAFRSK